MSRYLEYLLIHPVCSRLVMHELRSASAFVAPTTPKKQPQPLINETISHEKEKLTSTISSVDYPILTQYRDIDVSVTGWIDVNVGLGSRAAFKIFYEVFWSSNGAQFRLRKRYRQFRALYRLLDYHQLTTWTSTSGEISSVEGPLKYSPRRSKSAILSKKAEDKVCSIDMCCKYCYVELSSIKSMCLDVPIEGWEQETHTIGNACSSKCRQNMALPSPLAIDSERRHLALG